jgi:hypothetical protein
MIVDRWRRGDARRQCMVDVQRVRLPVSARALPCGVGVEEFTVGLTGNARRVSTPEVAIPSLLAAQRAHDDIMAIKFILMVTRWGMGVCAVNRSGWWGSVRWRGRQISPSIGTVLCCHRLRSQVNKQGQTRLAQSV